jgi:hypothetical protein
LRFWKKNFAKLFYIKNNLNVDQILVTCMHKITCANYCHLGIDVPRTTLHVGNFGHLLVTFSKTTSGRTALVCFPTFHRVFSARLNNLLFVHTAPLCIAVQVPPDKTYLGDVYNKAISMKGFQ